MAINFIDADTYVVQQWSKSIQGTRMLQKLLQDFTKIFEICRFFSLKCNHSFDKDFTYLVGTYLPTYLYIEALTGKKKVDPEYWLEKMQFIDSRVFCNTLEIAYLYFCGNITKKQAILIALIICTVHSLKLHQKTYV